ncbi:transcriptional regulator, AbrB family [Treponema vincentii ATCC 35580]|uniref:Transcriptional regulator, AbrB family n=1 Tax=Treponema vincentii ATCC 35580 TaxID=596324 RepID=C8PRL2_9SPIR|nr:AbrB/MazE/SpoVT family DNA-binding domain-containing protein [Treponema vincentii]EEV19947.1 transcriptional regulator, AbrB family [Treponema vincentii ATCC 35580]
MKHPEGKYAWTVKVGEKGQFVIPKEARDVFGINPGDTLIVLADIEKGIVIPPKNMFAHFMETIFNQNEPEEGEK